jgi:hypothetical protein
MGPKRAPSKPRPVGHATTGTPVSAGAAAAPRRAPRPQGVAPTLPPREQRPAPPVVPLSVAMQTQLAKQKEMRCDYVLVKLVQDPVAGRTVPRFCPLKLHHHPYLQLAFNTLKERCVRAVPPEVRDVVALHRFIERYLIGMASYQSRATAANAEAAEAAEGGRGGRGPPPRRGGAIGDDAPRAPPVRPLMTGVELRVQLRAEYGVDVFSDAARLASLPAAQADPEGMLLPHEMTEEEFYVQLGKPSNLAQQCCVM